jgi:CRP-like cAMP-binding protein
MSRFLDSCQQLSHIDTKAIADISEKLQNKDLQKGNFLLKEGQICENLYFIDSGLVKMYSMHNDKEFIMRFFPEDSFFTQLKSFNFKKTSDYSLIALEITSVTYLTYQDLQILCSKYHCVESFYRNLLSLATSKLMDRISEMLEENPAQRYNSFVTDNSDILQRISLGDLARYIGISQVSLSRIRSRK